MADKLTLEQQLAKKEKDLALIKQRIRKAENGQKIVIGGMMISLAKKDAGIAKQLLTYINNEITREADKGRLTSIIKELNETISKANKQQEKPQHPQQQNN